MNDNYNIVYEDNDRTGQPSQQKSSTGTISTIVNKLFRSHSRSRSQSRSRSRSNSTTNEHNAYIPPVPTSPHSKAVANHQQPHRTSLSSITNNANHIHNPNSHKERKRQQKHHLKNIKRYRGFSTSIASLFLDEQVVCGAISWCGLLASSRTEYLLQVRNEQLHKSQKKQGKEEEVREMPSTVLGFLLIVTIVFISLTYLIWGFGDVNNEDDQELHYKYYGRSLWNNDNIDIAKKFYVPGVMRVCDYDKRFWSPVNKLIWKMTPRPSSSSSSSLLSSGDRHLEENSSSNNISAYYYYQPNSSSTTDYTSWVEDQDLAYNLRLVVCLLFLIILGLFGRRRRMKTRFAVLKARAQDDKLHFSASNMQLEDKYAGACSHTLCGCYPIDRKVYRSNSVEELSQYEDDVIAPGVQKSHQDWINSAFGVFMSCCCGKLCNLWCQCFSICALAQEAREVRLLIPPKSQRVDFITHQPWNEYFKDIYDLRLRWKEKNNGVRRNYGSHFRALSLLSRSIIVTFAIATIVIILTEQFNPRVIFSWADACVLLLTFVQSFIVLGEYLRQYDDVDLSCL